MPEFLCFLTKYDSASQMPDGRRSTGVGPLRRVMYFESIILLTHSDCSVAFCDMCGGNLRPGWAGAVTISALTGLMRWPSQRRLGGRGGHLSSGRASATARPASAQPAPGGHVARPGATALWAWPTRRLRGPGRAAAVTRAGRRGSGGERPDRGNPRSASAVRPWPRGAGRSRTRPRRCGAARAAR
jgi:hypothetical protein